MILSRVKIEITSPKGIKFRKMLYLYWSSLIVSRRPGFESYTFNFVQIKKKLRCLLMSLQIICSSSTYLLGPIPLHVPDVVTWKPRWYPGVFLIFPTYVSCLPLVSGQSILLVTWAKNLLIFDSFLLTLPATPHQRPSLAASPSPA